MSSLVGTLTTLLISGFVCLITVGSLAVAGFFLYRMFKGMSQNSAVLKNGISAPAVIIDVQDTGVTMNDNPQARLTLQVTPAGHPPFQAVTTTFVNRFHVGMLTPGSTIQVKYDPNDISKVAIESLAGGGMAAMGGGAMSPNMQAVQNAVLAQDQFYNQLRQTGEEALAVITKAEETNIRAGDTGSLFRFTFNVTPTVGAPFTAETQAAVADTSRHKYSVGKKVYVRFDPNGDRKQVALDRSAESM